MNLLEATASGGTSIWVPVVVLGWFLLMTFIGWQVSRRYGPVGNPPPTVDPSHSESNPSEFDNY